MIQVPSSYINEANDALYEKLGRALGVVYDSPLTEPDWDQVEAVSHALVDLARTYTKPKGLNRRAAA